MSTPWNEKEEMLKGIPEQPDKKFEADIAPFCD